MGWIQTYTGAAFELPPRPSGVCLRDIARSLSMQCRFNGHVTRYYSVAEHSIHMSDYARTALGDLGAARWALLHDAPEAYLSDIPTPLKAMLPGYREMEEEVEKAILDHIGWYPDVISRAVVKELDSRILVDERRHLLGAPPKPWAMDQHQIIGIGLGSGALGMTWQEAEAVFLGRLSELFS